jgi:dihydropteroate synthase
MAFSFRELGLDVLDRERADLLLGERARALEARARSRGQLACAWEPELVRLWVQRARCTPEEAAALGAQPEVRATTLPGSDLAVLDAPRAALEALARERGVLGELLAAHDAATRAPAAPVVMGVVNVTPDSFSDGGRFLEPGAAVERALALVEAGARVLDVGGESTRPGAAPVSAERELERVLPVVRALAAATDVPVSVDTSKAQVAALCLASGARLVNDVSAGRNEPDLLGHVARARAGIVLMHMQGNPGDMQRSPAYADVVREVLAFLRERAAHCLAAGIDPERIAVDPGIGFGKTVEHNLALLRALPELRSLGMPIVLGVSRKSFLGALSGERDPADREAESLAATAIGAALGADVHRVHEPLAIVRALAVARGLRGP